jgi:tyrosinase
MASLTEEQQELFKHIQRIATQFPSSIVDRYTAVAPSFRMPYWDWAMGTKGGDIPTALMTESIEVTDFDGEVKMIDNPLYSYKFHPIIPGDFEGHVSPKNPFLFLIP